MTNTHGHLWPNLRQAIYDKYEVVTWLDILADDLDMKPTKLYQTLLPWQNAVFSYKQRIVIYHRDTDYYYEHAKDGFFMQNLYRIFAYLNISSEYVILLHASSNLDAESQRLAQQFNVPSMHSIYCLYQWCPMPDDVISMPLNSKDIQLPFSCLNGIPRTHRMYCLSVMKELDIFHKGIISLHKHQPKPLTQPAITSDSESMSILTQTNNVEKKLTQENFNSISFPKNLTLCRCEPLSRINDTLIFRPHQQHLMVKWFDSLGEYKSDLIVGNPNEPLTRYQPRFLQSALWNVVNETVGEYPHAFITEKTWKAILTKRPFVLLGGIGSLQTLKDQGFKTFDNWIDESYDQQPTFADRCDRALAQIKQFCNLNKKELQQIANQMSEILEHNFNHYINKFGQYKLEILIRDQL